MGQFGSVGLRIVSVQIFQGLGDTGVEAHAPGQGQLGGQSFLNQSVGELVPPHGLRQLLNDPRGQRLFQNLKQPVFGDLFNQRPNLGQGELPPDYRRHGQGFVATLGQPVQAPSDHLPYSLRNA